MGFVGLTLGLTLAESGHNVIGLEQNEISLKKLQNGNPHFYEKNLKKALTKKLEKKRIKFLRKFIELKKFDINYFIIAVGTPIDRNKKVHLKTIFKISKEIFSLIKKKTIVILRSTVKIGTTRKIEKIFKSKKIKLTLLFAQRELLRVTLLMN